MWTLFAIWIGLALLSWQWSIQPDVTIKSIWRDCAKGIIAFCICYVLAYRGLPHRIFAPGLLACSILFTGIALYDFVTYKMWQGPHSPPRYDISVSLLVFSALLFLNVDFKKHLWFKPLSLISWLALCLCMVTGVMSASRSFVVALIFGLGLIVYIYWDQIKAFHNRPIFTGLVSITALAMIVAGFSLLNPQRVLGHTQDRQILYSNVLEHSLKHPMTGTGFGHETNRLWYAEAFPKIPGGEGLAAATHAHNVFLSYLEQLGIPGLLLAIALFFSLARPCWIAAKSTSPKTRRLGCAGLLLILGALISNTFNFYFARHHLLLFMSLCGILHGWISKASLTEAPSSD